MNEETREKTPQELCMTIKELLSERDRLRTLVRTWIEDFKQMEKARDFWKTRAGKLAAVIKETVDRQAEDEGLWSVPFGLQPITEAYLQQELRRLHTVIEDALSDYEKEIGR